jgi:hypothetical protein
VSRSFTTWEEHSLRIIGNRVLMKIFGSKKAEVAGSGKKYLTRSFIICALRHILFRGSNKKQ